MLRLQRLPSVGKSEHRIIVIQDVERDIGSEAVLAMGHDVRSLRLNLYQAHDLAPGNAGPGGIQLAPTGDAMDIYHLSLVRQLHQIIPGQAQRLFHQAKDAQVPIVEALVDRGRSIVQDGEFLGDELAGRHATITADLGNIFDALQALDAFEWIFEIHARLLVIKAVKSY